MTEEFRNGYAAGYEAQQQGRILPDLTGGDYSSGYYCGYTDSATNRDPDYSQRRHKQMMRSLSFREFEKERLSFFAI